MAYNIQNAKRSPARTVDLTPRTRTGDGDSAQTLVPARGAPGPDGVDVSEPVTVAIIVQATPATEFKIYLPTVIR